MEFQHAADAAVGAYRLGHVLLGLIPRAGLAHVVLALEHQRPGRAHTDAISAVHTRGLWEPNRELGGDVSIEPAAGHADRKCVLRIDAARFHALVAEDAARVVAHI